MLLQGLRSMETSKEPPPDLLWWEGRHDGEGDSRSLVPGRSEKVTNLNWLPIACVLANREMRNNR